MGVNRKRIEAAAQKAGYPQVTLGLLYAAHNLGYRSVEKILKEKDSRKWDAQTKKYVSNQASELTQGGIGNYLRNAERSMSSHYSQANEGFGKTEVSQAEVAGVMSSVNPTQLASSQRTAAPIVLASAEVSPSNTQTVPITAATSSGSVKNNLNKSAINNNAPVYFGGSNQPRRSGSTGTNVAQEEPFRLPNGKMASI
jgi:hypothetical protein